MFLLRIVKTISSEEAEKIRRAKAIEEKLKTLADGNFLCKDLELPEIERKKQATLRQEKFVIKNLGFFKYPEYEFGVYFETLTYRKMPFSIYSPYAKNVKNLIFQGGIIPGRETVSLSLTDRREGVKDFEIGQFGYVPGIDYFAGEGNIHELARYFHDKRPLYKKIRKLLRDQRQAFEARLAPAFVEDLLILFSVRGKGKNLTTFKPSEKNVAKTLLQKRIVKKNWLFLSNALCYPKEDLALKYPPAGPIDLVFFLNTKNQLIVDVLCGWESEEKEEKTVLKALKANKTFDKFLEEMLSEFLKQLLSFASFGNELYEKVKTKIFFANI